MDGIKGLKGIGRLLCLCLLGILTGTTEFFFNYEDFYFNETFATIAWNTPLSCSGSISYSIIKAARGNIMNPKNPCSIQEGFTIIRQSSLQISFDFVYKIYVNACCDGMQFTIQNSIEIPAEVQTEVVAIKPSHDVCLQPSSFAITVIWPKQNKSGENCACSRWYQIQGCSCVISGSITNVYNIGESREEIKICWSNITNHTKVHFVIESLNPTDLLNPIPIPLVNQEFIRTYDLVLAESPHPPQISINMTDEQRRLMLCLQDIYDGQSPITYYVVTITDITSYGSIYFVNRTSNRCHDIPRNEPNYSMECRPLSITVQSYNGIGYSEPANFILNGASSNSDECECFKLNVNASSNIMNISNSQFLFLEVSCFTQYFQASKILIKVNLKRSSMVVDSIMAICNDSIRFDSLKSSTKYEIELKWVSQEGKDCLIFEPLVYNTPTVSSNSVTITLIVVMSIGVPLFILSLITIIILIVLLWKKNSWS